MKSIKIIILGLSLLLLTSCTCKSVSIPPPVSTYGEMWGLEIGETIITSINTYENITGLTEGELKGVTYSNDTLIIQKAGTYSINSQFSFNDGDNTEYHLSLGKNGNRLKHCHAQRKIGTGGDVGSASFTCIDMFDVGDNLTIMVENVDNTNNPDIQSINLNVVRLSS